jgi:hypothetical protein
VKAFIHGFSAVGLLWVWFGSSWVCRSSFEGACNPSKRSKRFMGSTQTTSNPFYEFQSPGPHMSFLLTWLPTCILLKGKNPLVVVTEY